MSDENGVTGFNEELRARLDDYRSRLELNNADLGRELGIGATQVSRYLSGAPNWDVSKLERVIDDVLKNEKTRKRSALALFKTPVSKLVDGAFETLRETNDVGVIFGPAGLGKTCGIQLYVADHPSAIALTATRWRRDCASVVAMLFHSGSTQSWKGNDSRADFVVRRLKDSNRLIIVDNAHRLTAAARELLFDLHDETGCPLALVGNPELLDEIRKNDQQFSRIGVKTELRLKPKEAGKVADQIVEQLAPEALLELRPLVEVVAEKQGHFRAVRKQLNLARKIKEGADAKPNYATAFRSAHRFLVRDYALDGGGK